jgi:hypothetical protein
MALRSRMRDPESSDDASTVEALPRFEDRLTLKGSYKGTKNDEVDARFMATPEDPKAAVNGKERKLCRPLVGGNRTVKFGESIEDGKYLELLLDEDFTVDDADAD